MSSSGSRVQSVALYSDVDGTLLGESGDVSPVTVKEIRRFVDAGNGFTLATGRSLPAVARLLQEIPVNLPVVLCNGAYVYDPLTQRTLCHGIERQVVEQVFSLLYPVPDIRVYVECSDTSLWSTDAASLQDPYIVKEQLALRCFERIEQVLEHGDVLKIGIKWMGPIHQDTAEWFTSIVGQIEALFSASVYCCLSGFDYLEIMPKGITKWTGIGHSQALSGNRQRMVVTVGDQHNDVDMIQQADLGIAMDNAVDAVKRVARMSIGHVDAHPIGQLLRDLRTGSLFGKVERISETP